MEIQNINDWLSKDRRLPLLKEGEKKEFRLAVFGKLDPVTGFPIRKPGHTLHGRDRIKDEGRSKLIMNIREYLPVANPMGGTRMEPVPGFIYFDQTGIIITTELENDKYLYLMNHNKNRDNPHRDPRTPVVFYVVDEERDFSIEKLSFEYKMFAGGYILNAAEADLLTLVHNLNGSGKKELTVDSTVRGQNLVRMLQPLTQSHPVDILVHSGDANQIMRVVVDFAIQAVWIVYNEHEKAKKWQWAPTSKLSSGFKLKKEIISVEEGDDPRKFLMSYLSTEHGSPHYAEMKAKYKEHYKLINL